MSNLLIRTEAPPEPDFVDRWRPRPAEAPPDDGDDTPFEPLIMALEDELTRTLGVAVSVHPGRGLAPGAPDFAPELGALLATIRLGGDVSRPVGQISGVVTTRHARVLGEQLLGLAHRLWPPGRRRPSITLDVLATVADDVSVVGSIRLTAPPDPVPVQPAVPLGAALFGLPVRLAVRIADEDVPLACLLPLQPGLVIPFNACPEMPVLLGDHQIACASLTPLPDGRQQASITATFLKPLGDRA
ncbi:hypothetical protein [Sandarakinorhabdus sp. AAP62]|uniref:hypothetical protein n=1 Tax=Sandarakinorhabdus sp. AAP62 TaxID=1248916 RepID=UPI0002DB0A5F|nr:hypothetical protein [Sandarakinorhabdus sp. AAP62]